MARYKGARAGMLVGHSVGGEGLSSRVGLEDVENEGSGPSALESRS